jgi:hypothetical protein
MESCTICCQAFTGVKRKSVPCAYCAFPACLECVQKFLLDTSSGYDPKCMNPRCDKPWTQDFIDEALPKSFRFGPLKKRRQEVLWERERSLLPGSTALVDRELELRHHKDVLKTLQERKRALVAELADLGDSIRGTEISIDVLQNTQGVMERRQFVRPCPGEDCRGYLSTQWKCGLCDIRVCSECHDIKTGDDHACNPDNLASAQALQRETRPCPKCGARIFKIDGCDQMYCTVEGCHTAFSWRTGRIETGHIHNPHYYDWVRQNNNGVVPRDPRDNPCLPDQFPDVYAIRMHLRNNPGLVCLDYDKYHRMAVHIRFHEIPQNGGGQPVGGGWHRDRRRPTVTDPDMKNADLRVKYLLKEMDDTSFKKELFRRHKTDEVTTARHNLMSMYVDVSADLFRAILATKAQDRVDSIVEEFKALRRYFNKQSEAISNRFNLSVFKRIRSTWAMDTAHLKKGPAPTIDLTRATGDV